MRERGFTLVEVLVALVVVALGLGALLTAVSSTARTSGILREKMEAQWIALNRLTEVRLNLIKFGTNTDAGEVKFGNRTWHYDTKYFDTNVQTMRRVVVRVYAGEAKEKGNPLAETVGFLSTAFPSPPGQSNYTDWRASKLAAGSGAQTPVNTPADPNNPRGATPTNPSNPGTPSTPGGGTTPTVTPTSPPTPTNNHGATP